MSCHSGRSYDASEYADTWTYVDKSLFGSNERKNLRRAGKSSMGSKKETVAPIVMSRYQFQQLLARANDPVDSVPVKKQRPKHAVKIKRFANPKPTVQDEYTKRVRQ